MTNNIDYSRNLVVLSVFAFFVPAFVSQVISQLLLGTDWGELEYLIIDMPPGVREVVILMEDLNGRTVPFCWGAAPVLYALTSILSKKDRMK